MEPSKSQSWDRRTPRQRVSASGLPRRHRDRLYEPLEWSDEDRTRAYTVWFRLCTGGPVVALRGPVGTGKTQLAAQMVAWACDEYTAIYRTFADLCAQWKARAFDGGESEGDVVRSLVAPWLLVIDDLQTSYGSETEYRILERVIDKRYGEKRPTLLIANFTDKALAEFLGPRVCDRIREGGGMYSMEGRSRRG